MTDNEHQEALTMRRRLVKYLDATHEQIIAYPYDANDEDHDFLIRKAIYYQELIDTIDQQLNATNE